MNPTSYDQALRERLRANDASILAVIWVVTHERMSRLPFSTEALRELL